MHENLEAHPVIALKKHSSRVFVYRNLTRLSGYAILPNGTGMSKQSAPLMGATTPCF
jgi:hypothetical protein